MSFENITDYTNLKTDASKEDIKNLCKTAIENKCYSVCVSPYYVTLAKELLEEKVKVCTVIGFPNGYSVAEVKYNEAFSAILDGADEVDMVANISAIKCGRWDYVADEIFMINQTCKKQNVILKVIIETCLLTKEEKIRICEIIKEIGVDFVKTSTGFSKSGATVDDVKLIKSVVGTSVKIKASGGIKTADFARELVEAGADRLGSSTLV